MSGRDMRVEASEIPEVLVSVSGPAQLSVACSMKLQYWSGFQCSNLIGWVRVY